MRTALITTTINVPKVLDLYRAHGSEVEIFVAADEKTPQLVEEFCGSKAINYLTLSSQDYLYPELSRLIGRNTIARRNIALLEALKWGAEIIVTVDDDNIPIASDYFDQFEIALATPFSGVQVRGISHWFDVGNFLDPPSPHRGFPLETLNAYEVEYAVDAKVGVAAGICLGDPDIAAFTRLARHPTVYRGSQLLDAGVVVSPDTWTVFNSQNTAFLRELAPCFLMLPQIGRYDDIFASIVAQKIMYDRGLQVHFGKPYVWQQRNPHNLVSDLKKELWGYENIWPISNHIAKLVLPLNGAGMIEQLRDLYLAIDPFMPAWHTSALELATVWLDECDKIVEYVKDPGIRTSFT